MKTIWKGQGPKKTVTRDEIGELVRRELLAVFEALLFPQRVVLAETTPIKIAGVPVGPELARGLALARKIAPAAAEAKPEKKKTHRAVGHVHRGRCGPRCFTGERGPK
jgi:hypothetical protein